MRASLLVLLGLLAAAPCGAAARPCPAAVGSAFASCLARAASAREACIARDRAACADRAERAAARLRRVVLARCTDDAVRAGGYAPPFDAAALATRLARSCLANAAALVDRAAEGTGERGSCARAVATASSRAAVRHFKATVACTVAGRPCADGRSPRAPRAVAKRCRRAALPDGALDGLLARARGQMACALADALPASGTCAPSGAEALVDLWRLATPRPPGTLAGQVSSYDRSGGNVDLGIGPDTAPLLANLGLPSVELDFSYLYREGDRYVVFDETGPGVVWRIWMTGLDGLFTGHLAGDIAFELDDEVLPRLTLTREQLFAGTTAPFLAPLAGDTVASSGGFYSVVPIAFARRLRITTSTVPNWLQVTFTRLPPDQAVTSFDPAVDTGPVATLLERAGDPATTVPPDATDEVALSVPPATTATVWSRAGAGTIVRVELVAPDAATDVPLDLRLRATFDDAPAPQVDAPLDDLFGAALGAGAKSFAFGRDGGRYYCYFPMPFERSARLDVRNDGAAAFTGWTLRVGRVDALPPGPLARFHARAAAAHPGADGRDYVLLDAAGAGHVVGVVLTAGCAGTGLCQLSNLPGADGAHLEGDERIAVDGSRWPQWHGTGLEDFFGGGFYFLRGAFALPTHGNPAQVPTTSSRRPGLNLRSAYRLLPGDAIPFRNAIRLAIEHGPTNDAPADFSSLVFFYARDGAVLAETDRVALGDGASEGAHALVATDRTNASLTSSFRGDDSDVPVSATGMTARVTQLTLAVDPANVGVRLRRLADVGAGRQAARVTVNGAFAGVWRTADVNPVLRWAEPEIEIPAALTAGRSTLAVELDASDSPGPWTAFGYVALSHVR